MKHTVWITSFILLFSDAGWGTQKWTTSVPPAIPPNGSTMRIGVGCYDAWTFLPLDCQFSFSLTGIELSGGHIHYDRPNGGLSISPLLPAIFVNISDHTDYQYKTLRYEAPQASGIVTLNSTYTPPYGYRCLNPADCKYEGTINIRIEGLQDLPASGDHHVVVRGGTASHPQGTSATPKTIETFEEIAEKYFLLTDGRRLSVNDISLPGGGLFDVDGTWSPPHVSHRIGTDVDINRADGGGVLRNCTQDIYLRNAIAAVAAETEFAHLLCESGGRKHIDFD